MIKKTCSSSCIAKGPIYVSSTRCKIGFDCSSRTVAYETYDTVCKARLNLVNRYLQGVDDEELDLALVLFNGGDWFHVSRYVKSQNNTYCSAENHVLIHKRPISAAALVHHKAKTIYIYIYIYINYRIKDNLFSVQHISTFHKVKCRTNCSNYIDIKFHIFHQ